VLVLSANPVEKVRIVRNQRVDLLTADATTQRDGDDPAVLDDPPDGT
jgi:hypothetical protein